MLCRLALLAALATVALAKGRRKHDYNVKLPDPAQYMVEGQEASQPTGYFLQKSAFTKLDGKDAYDAFGTPLKPLFSGAASGVGEQCPSYTLIGTSRITWDFTTSTCLVDYTYFDMEAKSGSVRVMGEKGVWSESTKSCTWGKTPAGEDAYYMSLYQEHRLCLEDACDPTQAVQDISSGLLDQFQYVVIYGGKGTCMQQFYTDYENTLQRRANNLGPLELRLYAIPVTGLSEMLVITQTRQGGYKIDGAVVISADSEAGSEPGSDDNAFDRTAKVNLYEFASYGVYCSYAFYDPETRDLDGTLNDDTFEVSPKKDNRKNGQRPNVNKGCPSFFAGAFEFGGLNDDLANNKPSMNFWNFKANAKYRDGRGIPFKRPMEISVQQSDYTTDDYIVAVSFPDIGEEYIANFRRQSERPKSDLEILNLKNRETGNTDPSYPYKEAQDGGTSELGELPPSLDKQHKANKKTSYKKRTKRGKRGRRNKRPGNGN